MGMYQVGQYIIYGNDGVCKVEAIGSLDMRGVREGVNYYTLKPLYQTGKIYVPVDTEKFSRPVMSREEALALIKEIPNIPAEIYENNNPRLLGEHYQNYLKTHECKDLLRVIRSIYVKSEKATARGRRLGQVDERSLKQAMEILHGELSVALGIEKDQVEDYIVKMLEND